MTVATPVGATIIYTTDDSNPTADASCNATNGIAISSGTTAIIDASGALKAIGCGIGWGDAKCMNAAYGYPGTGIYKALIVSGGLRRASQNPNVGDNQVDWVLKPNSDYYRNDEPTKIMTTNTYGLFEFGTLTDSFGAVAGYSWNNELSRLIFVIARPFPHPVPFVPWK